MLTRVEPETPPVSVVDASPIALRPGLYALWEHRDLLYLLTARDVKLRYQHTMVGAAWVLLQPLLIMLVLAGFASIAGLRTGNIPYPLFVISGLVPWTYFTHGFTSTTHSLSAHSDIIGKIYFPRLLIPVATALAGAIDFGVAALLLPLFMIAYGVHPTWALLAVPAFVAMALVTAFAMGLWLAVLNIRYHDIANALPFFTQLLFFITPLVYNSAAIPEPWRTVVGLNPLVGVIDGFRWALLGKGAEPLHPSLLVSIASLLVLLTGGILLFLRREPALADEL